MIVQRDIEHGGILVSGTSYEPTDADLLLYLCLVPMKVIPEARAQTYADPRKSRDHFRRYLGGRTCASAP